MEALRQSYINMKPASPPPMNKPKVAKKTERTCLFPKIPCDSTPSKNVPNKKKEEKGVTLPKEESYKLVVSFYVLSV